MSQKPTLSQILAELDGWNESRHGAKHNEKLCAMLGYEYGNNKLSERLFEFIKGEISPKLSRETDDLFPAHELPPPKPTSHSDATPAQEAIDDMWRQIQANELPIKPYAEMVLKSGWDFTAPNLKKVEYDVRDFLEERTLEGDIPFKDLTSGQRGLFYYINRGFRNWVKKEEAKKLYGGFGQI